MSLQGYSNQQAVEMLRSTGRVGHLKMVRYGHGLKFEQLQQAIASSNAATPNSSNPTIPTPSLSLVTKESEPIAKEETSPKHKILSPPTPPRRTDYLVTEEITPPKEAMNIPELPIAEPPEVFDDYEAELKPSVEEALIKKWSEVLGGEYDIIVAQLSKFKEGGGAWY